MYISKKKNILLLNYWTIENYTSVENWLFKSFNLPLNTCLSTHFSLKGFLSFDLLPKTDFKFVTFFMFHHFKIAPLVVRLCTFPFLMIELYGRPLSVKLTHLKLNHYMIDWGCHYMLMGHNQPKTSILQAKYNTFSLTD